jgi:hypothetical protein
MHAPRSVPRTASCALTLAVCAASAQAQIIDWYAYEPRVVTDTQADPVTFTVRILGQATSVVFLPKTGGSLPLAQIDSTHWQIVLTPAQVLAGYSVGADHNYIGRLQALPSPIKISQFANVRHAAMPNVEFVDIGPDVRVSPHVLNLREDVLLLGNHAAPPLFHRIYDVVPDEYDFVAMVEQVRSSHNRSFRNLRNTIQGLGISITSQAGAYGSPARLKGDVLFPIDSYFDLAGKANSHELGHNWSAHQNVPALISGQPHWPLSDLAQGIMGFGSLDFPYTLTPVAGGNYKVQLTGSDREFNDMELYQMGLVDQMEVGSYVVFDDQNQAVFPGATLQGPTTTVTVADVIAADGVRVPSAADSPKAFRELTVVLSRGGLLTPDELAFFDHMAARGALQVEVPFTSGFDSGTTKPFYLATGGRAELATDVELSPLVAVPKQLSLAAGGSQDMLLSAGPELAGELYLLLGSTSGSNPGTPVGDIVLPLNLDPYFTFTLGNFNSPLLPGSFGTLDADGRAWASLVLPPGLSPSLSGLGFHHAAVVFTVTGQALFVSEPEFLLLVP